MRSQDTLLFSAVNLTAGFDSGLKATGVQKRGTGPQRPGSEVADSTCFVSVNCSAITGTSPTMDVDVVATIGGVDIVIASFAQITAAGNQTLKVEGCPSNIKLVGTAGGTITDFDAEFACTRLVD